MYFEIIDKPTTTTRVFKPFKKMPVLFSRRMRYTADSDLVQLKKGFCAELIRNPSASLMKAGVLHQATEELGMILLKAFGKKDSDKSVFLSGDKFTKVALWVDYLLVIRKQGRPVAFCAGSFVNSFIFYINSLMVLPQYQTTGIGSVASVLLWRNVLKDAQEKGDREIDIVCRTQNKGVVSGILRLIDNGVVSTEKNLGLYKHMIIEKVAQYLRSEVDHDTGISSNVYPEGLPKGDEINDLRVHNAMQSMRGTDACYVTGRLNAEYCERILKRFIIPRVVADTPSKQYQPQLQVCAYA